MFVINFQYCEARKFQFKTGFDKNEYALMVHFILFEQWIFLKFYDINMEHGTKTLCTMEKLWHKKKITFTWINNIT